MDSLSHVASKVFGHFFAVANIPAISIGQITTQQRQSKTVATELIAGTLQLRLISLNAQRSE
jgi:hypothetical protein